MKIATWNVNSLKVRLPQVLDWLATQSPDVLCLQELKIEDAAFPVEAIQQAGYQAAFAGQKTYNGVAILSRQTMHDVQIGIPGFEDHQKRLICASIQGIRIVSAYFPNGQALDSDKYLYKLDWLKALTAWLKQMLPIHPQLVLAGDFNIAPCPEDVHSSSKDPLLTSPPERAAFQALLDLGLEDSFHRFEKPENRYTWWDYRMGAFRRNAGLRIDHILNSQTLHDQVLDFNIDRAPRALERPSDHTPVILTLGNLATA